MGEERANVKAGALRRGRRRWYTEASGWKSMLYTEQRARKREGADVLTASDALGSFFLPTSLKSKCMLAGVLTAGCSSSHSSCQ